MGKLIGLIYITVSIMLAATFTRDFVELFLNFIFPYVPLTILVLLTLATSACIIRIGLVGIGRLAELLVPLLVGAIIIGVILSIDNVNYIPAITLQQSWSALLTDALAHVPYLVLILVNSDHRSYNIRPSIPEISGHRSCGIRPPLSYDSANSRHLMSEV